MSKWYAVSAPTNVQHAVTLVITKPINKDQHKNLHRASLKGDWSEAESILKSNKDVVKEAICNDGSTILHIAVGKGDKGFIQNLISYINVADVLVKRSSDGSTALHIAAIVGNTYAADLLVKKNKNLLQIKDHKNQEALHKAYEYLHLDTIEYLSKATEDWADVEISVDLLVNVISGNQYNLASKLIKKFPNLAVQNDEVLMAIAKSFPSGLGYWEALLYPSLGTIWKTILSTGIMSLTHVKMSLVPLRILLFVYQLIYFLILMICFLFLVLYYALWMATVITPFKHMKKKKEWEEAKRVLRLVCDEIDKLEIAATRNSFYNRTIIVAECQGAYKVVDEILFRSPEAIQSTDEKGHDIIQLAVLHRSVKIYNLIYDDVERKNLYKKLLDSSKNNMLHLAGRLAPSHKLDQRSNPALQLQGELQWYMEVKKLVFPTYITQENNSKETPDTVFTREHENLLNAGENWMTSTAKSGNIIAALITTIVFTAAITVPGGSNAEGVPVLKDSTAFTIFLIADVISLCGSSTAILAFTSIIIAPFAEKYFLNALPIRILLGHFSLFLSTTSMMVAFSATTYHVFYDENPWKIGPLCALAELPIIYFISQEIPMIVVLIWSTYVSIFGKRRKSAYIRFHPDKLRLYLAL
ncbi:unnamed protein product [Lactuca virosa]|uniref:PGG domain-containing protein n=1 Tax=Lactuca virosa TaxID=75947 RepID=A0AAU9PFS7_9ASTR|nr:unnamed protein product [Lactuca virosa]